MLVGYLQYLNRSRVPMVLRLAGSARTYGNAAGTRLIDDPATQAAFDEHATEVAASGNAVSAVLAGRIFAFGPIFDLRGSVEGVLAAAVPLPEIPRILDEIRRPSQALSRLMDGFPHPVITARPTGEIDFLSGRWYRLSGTAAEANRGNYLETFLEAIPANERARVLDRWHAGVIGRGDFSFELPLVTVQGVRWFVLHATPSLVGGHLIKWHATVVDIHEQVTARDALARGERQQRVIAEVSRVFNTAPDIATIVRAIARYPLPRGETWAVSLGERGRRVRGAGSVDVEQRLDAMRDLVRGAPGAEFVCGPLDARRNALAVRISGRAAYGYIAVTAPESQAELQAEWLPVLQELSGRLSVTLERMLTFERERFVVETLQRAMLPAALPAVAGIAFDVAYLPASADILVGGDWYDVFELPEDRLGLAVGDVAGHGLDASIVMSQLRHIIRAASRDDDDPARVLAHANRVLFTEGPTFATAFYGVLDGLTLRLAYGCAGHPPPLVVDAGGRVSALPCDGLVLGVGEGPPARTMYADVPPGGALVLYTDGVVESSRDLLTGEARLRETLEAWGRTGFLGSAAELQDAVIGTGTHSDDAAMLVVRIPHLQRLNVAVPATPHNARRLRLAVARFLEGCGFDSDGSSDATLAIAEAINNAVVHAYGGGDGVGTVRVALRRVRDGLVASVQDAGQWPDGTTALRGHGLDIMHRLLPDVSVRRGSAGSKVSFRIPWPAVLV